MKWTSAIKTFASVLTLAVVLVSVPAVANTADNTDLHQQRLEILIDKFAAGQYSRTGADTCLGCHDAAVGEKAAATGIFDTVHGDKLHPGSPMAELQCESCHGPLGSHRSRPRGKKEREPMITFGADSPLSPAQQNSVCMSCHEDHSRESWLGSMHESQELACVDCHSLHQRDEILYKDSQTEVCTSCHTDVKMDLHKRSSHPIESGAFGSRFNWQSGALNCSDCHTSHGSDNQASLMRETLNESCYDCHAEKRGPKLWEHAPVVEDCSSCHTPHGSNNPALLTQRLPQLCQECHASPHSGQAITDPESDKIRGQSCTNCHSQVHGSNHPSGQALMQ